jgi:FKBP-type peptidyl-prolyl cis-trans isomerase FkpA
MKKAIVSTLVFAILLLASCKVKDGATEATKDKAKTTSSPSYAFGVAIGQSLAQTGVDVDMNEFMKGVKDVVQKKSPKLTQEEAQQVIMTALQEGQTKKAADNLAAGAKFLAENGKKSGIVTTASGLQYESITEGTGAAPKATDTVKVDYVGTLLDGTKFDSSIDRGQSAEFPLNAVIPGWTEGIQLMKVGGKAKLYIPAALAYGENGAGDTIGPNETLVFEVTLVDIIPEAKE